MGRDRGVGRTDVYHEGYTTRTGKEGDTRVLVRGRVDDPNEVSLSLSSLPIVFGQKH